MSGSQGVAWNDLVFRSQALAGKARQARISVPEWDPLYQSNQIPTNKEYT